MRQRQQQEQQQQTGQLKVVSVKPVWQKLAAFRRGKKRPQKFRRARICYFRDKCIVFARKCKIANLVQYTMQYIPWNSASLAQETLFLNQRSTFLAKSFPKSKLRQILISRQNSVLGPKIFLWVQTFWQMPAFLLPNLNNKKSLTKKEIWMCHIINESCSYSCQHCNN